MEASDDTDGVAEHNDVMANVSGSDGKRDGEKSVEFEDFEDWGTLDVDGV